MARIPDNIGRGGCYDAHGTPSHYMGHLHFQLGGEPISEPSVAITLAEWLGLDHSELSRIMIMMDEIESVDPRAMGETLLLEALKAAGRTEIPPGALRPA